MTWEETLVRGLQEAQRRSIVGPGDVRVHLDQARRMAVWLEPASRALDLGSGAGLPGLVLAGDWPESRWVLVDAARRRTRLLEQLVLDLGWDDRVAVIHGRAELLGRGDELRERFDLVTARLFGPPAVTAECGAPFLAMGGVLAVTEPPEPGPGRWSEDGVRALGLEMSHRHEGLQLFVRTHPIADRFPRNVGVPERRPLF